jgi:NRAMP (natural resistance-associated macrophage protein)-like metal ion transporter
MLKKIQILLSRIGPGFIVAAACLGPGSVTTSSKIGAEHGFSFLWVLAAASLAMGIYMSMSAKFGVTHKASILMCITQNYGRWFAVIIGISAFLASMSFQFGNVLGSATALNALTSVHENVWPLIITPLGLFLILFGKKSLYPIVEKLMIILSVTMIGAFLLNLLFTKPEIVTAVKGFLPTTLNKNAFNEIAALIGTTFVLHACLYQSYLVQEKGWRTSDLKDVIRDSTMGIVMLGGISMVIIVTSASALHPQGIQISSAADMAIQLEALFGSFAKYVFSIGLFSASFSSLLVNAMIGSTLVSDGFGLGRSFNDLAPKIFATMIMVAGMSVAVFFKGNIVYALVLAQVSSLFAVSTIAIGLLLTLNNKFVMGDLKNTLVVNVIAFFGLILIVIMDYYLYIRLFSMLQRI